MRLLLCNCLLDDEAPRTSELFGDKLHTNRHLTVQLQIAELADLLTYISHRILKGLI